MKKEDMKADITSFYSQNKELFIWCGIKPTTFFKWLDSFNRHSQFLKLTTYFFGETGLDAASQLAMSYWKARPQMTPEAWEILKLTDPGSQLLQELNGACVLIRTKWKYKLTKRRKSE